MSALPSDDIMPNGKKLTRAQHKLLNEVRECRVPITVDGRRGSVAKSLRSLGLITCKMSLRGGPIARQGCRKVGLRPPQTGGPVMSDDELVRIIAHGIADAQGDAYAEYTSEFDGYAKAAVGALKKHSAGLSMGGVHVWGSPDDIKAVMEWQHSHATIDDVRAQARHWRENCGKVHAHRVELIHFLERAIAVWDAETFDELAANAVLKEAVEIVSSLGLRQ